MMNKRNTVNNLWNKKLSLRSIENYFLNMEAFTSHQNERQNLVSLKMNTYNVNTLYTFSFGNHLPKHITR